MKRKHMIIAGMILMMAAGCSNASETTDSAPAELSQMPYNTPETQPANGSDSPNETAGTPATLSQDNENSPANPTQENNDGSANLTQDNDDSPANPAQENSDDSLNLDLGSPDAEIIGGKVRSVSQGQFVISRTLIEDSFVTMPEPGSPDEVLVTVRCTDSTIYELWTIQGGGAGITRKDAAFSDIQTGGGLEVTGSFEGEEFVADKVIIELYE